jgi:hypothetical protein
MNPVSPETGELLAKLIAKAIDGPAALARVVAIATLHFVEAVAKLIDEGVAEDIERVRKSFMQRIDSEGEIAAAEAKRRMAEAAEAANRATLHKRNEAIGRAQQALLKAKAAKTEAEAEAIAKDAETRRMQAMADGKERLMEAIAKLRSEGGEIIFDRKNLEKVRKAGLLEKPVEEMGLSMRVVKMLRKIHVLKVRDLTDITEAELLSYRGFGVGSLKEVKRALGEFGLSLRGRDEGSRA